MPTQYTGLATLSYNSAITVVNGATNATPIIISTTTSHQYSTGNRVIISGVTGNTAANGSWRITVVDGTHFSLDTSVGNGVYAGSGAANDVAITPAMLLPSDGDPFSAGSVNAAIECIANRTQMLNESMGGFGFQATTFTANGNYTTGPYQFFAALFGCGGGGGGGGSIQNASGFLGVLAGGGGGGSPGQWQIVPVTPNTTYAVVLGTGGAGGGVVVAGGAFGGANGANGTTTSFGGALALFIGGGGGKATTQSPSGDELYTFGGTTASNANSHINTVENYFNFALNTQAMAPGQGGWGANGDLSGANPGHAGRPGMSSLTGFQGGAGGVGGSPGTVTATPTSGGGGGGGGGAGGFGAGGAGGAGGSVTAGAPGAGAAGVAAGANTGAGGGGIGGMSGGGSAASGLTGGAGGSGKLIVYAIGGTSFVRP